MGKWKAAGPIVLALVIAVVGSYFIYSWMQYQAAKPGVTTAEKQAPANVVQVAVAAVDMIPGTKLSPEMIKKEDFLGKSIPPGSFTDPAALAGRVTVASLKTGEPITEQRLAAVDVKIGGVSALVKDGYRAVAVGGDKVIGLSGFIYPGNHVDVLVTWKDPKTENEITKLVLSNVPVLATGTLMQKNEKGEAAPVDVYTLELSPDEAEILTLARNEGRIQFALRNPADSGAVLTRGANYDVAMNHLLAKLNPNQQPQAVKAAAAPSAPVKLYRPAPKKQKITVEVISSGKLTKQTF
jgi:pilus assembly protein CpaB